MRGFLEELDFGDWILRLATAKRAVLTTLDMLTDAARLGIAEGLRAGITTYADTCDSGVALAAMREAGLEADGVVGDSNPLTAVRETWDPAKFDEIVVSTLPTGVSRWLQIDLPHQVERVTGVPCEHVVAERQPL
jgi:cytosine/adenosine deaminase-related metal-dependent hydrolase